jgi:AcrR family transcriptional regulator
VVCWLSNKRQKVLINEGKTDRRVKRTRQLLQQALGELLAEKQFSEITVQDITERAEVNRATFYAHFPDKYALLNHSVREKFQEKLDERLSPNPDFTEDNLRILILTVCEYLGGFIGHCVPTLSPTPDHDHMMMSAQVQQHVYDVILGWLSTSNRRTSIAIPAERMAAMISWTVFGSVLHWSHDGRKLSAEKLTDQIVGTLTTGLQPYLEGTKV